MKLKKVLVGTICSIVPSLVVADVQPPSYLPKEVVRREKLLRFVHGKEINEGNVKLSVGVYREDTKGGEAVTQIVLHPITSISAEEFRRWWEGKLGSAPSEVRDKFLQSVDDLDEGEQVALTFYPGGGDVMMGTRDKVKFAGPTFRSVVLTLFEK